VPRLPALVSLLAPIAALAQSPAAWVTTSDDARAVAEQRVQKGGCRLTVKRGESLAWTSELCVADRDDYRFLSNDGLSLLVLYAFPEQGAGPRAAKAGALYKSGRKAKDFAVGQFVADSRPLVMTKSHFYWLEGALGQPGVPPGMSKDARRVELTTLDRRNYTVSFDGDIRGPLKTQFKAH
jgi:hypothetical protein